MWADQALLKASQIRRTQQEQPLGTAVVLQTCQLICLHMDEDEDLQDRPSSKTIQNPLNEGTYEGLKMWQKLQ